MNLNMFRWSFAICTAFVIQPSCWPRESKSLAQHLLHNLGRVLTIHQPRVSTPFELQSTALNHMLKPACRLSFVVSPGNTKAATKIADQLILIDTQFAQDNEAIRWRDINGT